MSLIISLFYYLSLLIILITLLSLSYVGHTIHLRHKLSSQTLCSCLSSDLCQHIHPFPYTELTLNLYIQYIYSLWMQSVHIFVCFVGVARICRCFPGITAPLFVRHKFQCLVYYYVPPSASIIAPSIEL